MRIKVEYLDGTSDISPDYDDSWEDLKNLLINVTGRVISFHTFGGEIIVPLSAIKRISQYDGDE